MTPPPLILPSILSPGTGPIGVPALPSAPVSYGQPNSRYWVPGGNGNWSSTTNWSSSSGGAAGASVPTSLNDAHFDANSGTGSATIDVPSSCNSLDCTGFTGSLLFSANLSVVAAPGGVLRFYSGMTITTGGQTINLAGGSISNPGTIWSVGKTLPAINLSTGGIWQLGDTLSSGGFTLTSGTLITNNNFWTCPSFNCNNSNTRTLTLGSSLIKVTGSTFNSIDFGTSTNLTITANTAIFWLSAGGGINNPSNFNYNGTSLKFTGGGTNQGIYGATGCTFNNLNVVGVNKTDSFSFANNITFTGRVQFDGASNTAKLLVFQNSGPRAGGSSAAINITVNGTNTWNNADSQDLNFVNAGGVTTNYNTATVSGNEISDASRLAALSWGTTQLGGSVDQFSLFNGGLAIWEPATNIFPRGQCDVATFWQAAGSGVPTPVVDTSFPAPFSPNSIKVTCDGTASAQGINAITNTGMAAIAGTNGIGGMWFCGVLGNQYDVWSRWSTDAGTGVADGPISTITATGAWQWVPSSGPAVVPATHTGDAIFLFIRTHSARAESFHVAHTMIQTGKIIVSPYVATSGSNSATGFRGAGRFQSSSSVLSATQGWLALRVAPGWDSNTNPTTPNQPYLFTWNDGTASNRIEVLLSGAGQWRVIRSSGGVSGTAFSGLVTWSRYQPITIVVYWTATQIGISFNGGAFVTLADTNIPTGLSALFDIGSTPIGTEGQTYFNGNVLWAACGSGTLANADATTINGYGNAPAGLGSFPGSATAVFPFINAVYQDISGATNNFVGDAGGNTGVSFTSSVTQTWQGTAGGNWSDNTKWTSRVPLPQDDVLIGSAFIATQTITIDMPRAGRSIDFTGTTGNPTFARSVASRIYGSLTLVNNLVIGSINNLDFAGNGSYTITTAGKLTSPSVGWTLKIIAPGGTYTLQDDLVLYSGANTGTTFQLVAGIFDANGHNVNTAKLSMAGPSTRTVKFGSGTWTLNGISGSIIDTGNAATITVIPGTAAVILSDTGSGSKTIGGANGFAQNYPSVQYLGGSGPLNILGNITFPNLDVEYSSGATLTTSGNEITDASRTAALSWGITQQGGSVDGPYVTNLVQNGGFETNTNGYGANNVATLSRDTSTSLYGSASLKTVLGNVSAFEGWGSAILSTIVAGLTYTASVWLKSDVTMQVRLRIDEGVNGNSQTAPITLTSQWQRLTISRTLVGSSASLIVFTTAQTAGTIWTDGVQLEAGAVANNYVDTNGGAIASSIVAPNGTAIWEAGTNLFRRGQCDSVGIGNSSSDSLWGGNNAGMVISVDATVVAPFSPRSIKYVVDGTVPQLAWAKSATGQAAAAGVNGVGSIYFKGTAGNNYLTRMVWTNTDATNFTGAPFNFVGTGSWQLVTPPSFAVSTGKIGDVVAIEVGPSAASAETFWVAHAMLQSGFSAVSPYVATSGGSTATRGVGNISAPSSLLSAAQGWVAVLWKAGWAAASRIDFPQLWEWRTDSANRIGVIYNGSTSKWAMDTRLANLPVDSNSSLQTFAIGDLILLIGTWSSSQIGLSINGSVFNKTTNTSFVTPTGTTINIGGQSAGAGNIDGSILWTMGGIGTLSDTDAATLNSLGNTVPTISTLPKTSGTTFIWPAATSAYLPGKDIILPAGGTTTITGRLTLSGTAADQINVISASPGTSSTLQINAGGTTTLSNYFLSGDIIFNQAKSGGSISPGIGGASERSLHVETGGALSSSIGGATERRLSVETGGAISSGVGGGSELNLRSKTGGSLSSGVGGATRNTGFSKTGGGLSNLVGGGTWTKKFEETGGGISTLTAGGSRFTVIVETGGGIISFVGGGSMGQAIFPTYKQPTLLSAKGDDPEILSGKVSDAVLVNGKASDAILVGATLS